MSLGAKDDFGQECAEGVTFPPGVPSYKRKDSKKITDKGGKGDG